MTAGDEFRVAIKNSARRVLEAAPLPAADDADVCTYPSRAAADAAIDDLALSAAGHLELQAPAPNDPDDVDAYLVFYPEDRKRDPDGSLADGWTFDTTANQYGAVGEALVTAPGTPALHHFVRQDRAVATDATRTERVRVHCTTRPADFDWATLRSASGSNRPGWTPDCEVRVYPPGREDPIHRYFCEIKTGDASFERNQAADMAAVSTVADVLEIRVTIDELPDAYSVTFHRVGDTSPDDDVTLDGSVIEGTPGDQTGLSDFLD